MTENLLSVQAAEQRASHRLQCLDATLSLMRAAGWTVTRADEIAAGARVELLMNGRSAVDVARTIFDEFDSCRPAGEPQQRKVCSYCVSYGRPQRVLRDGIEPTSHGVCPECSTDVENGRAQVVRAPHANAAIESTLAGTELAIKRLSVEIDEHARAIETMRCIVQLHGVLAGIIDEARIAQTSGRHVEDLQQLQRVMRARHASLVMQRDGFAQTLRDVGRLSPAIAALLQPAADAPIAPVDARD